MDPTALLRAIASSRVTQVLATAVVSSAITHFYTKRRYAAESKGKRRTELVDLVRDVEAKLARVIHKLELLMAHGSQLARATVGIGAQDNAYGLAREKTVELIDEYDHARRELLQTVRRLRERCHADPKAAELAKKIEDLIPEGGLPVERGLQQLVTAQYSAFNPLASGLVQALQSHLTGQQTDL